MEIIVSSFGGVGTTPFLSWLSSKVNTNCPRDSDGLKHSTSPALISEKAERFVFIYGDPVEALLSLYSRKYIRPQFKKLTGADNTVSLEEYSLSGKDLICYEKQLDAWLSYSEKPILFLKYPYFWQYEDEIISFLNLPSDTKLFSKKERSSKKLDYNRETISRLEDIYESLNSKIENLGDFYIKD